MEDKKYIKEKPRKSARGISRTQQEPNKYTGHDPEDTIWRMEEDLKRGRKPMKYMSRDKSTKSTEAPANMLWSLLKQGYLADRMRK